ncbi:MAG: ABC transporter substrate-binding protein, partial [Candidatus Limnocylindrales bacterium]
MKRFLLLSLVAAPLLAACGSGATVAPGAASAAAGTAGSTPASAGASVAATSSGPPTRLTVGLGYIPSVQFAPFYLAQQAGYYAAAGLDVTFENKIDPDLIT